MSIWTLCRQAWSGRYTQGGELAAAQCVLGFSFGGVKHRTSMQPGVSNEDLAQFASQHFAALPRVFQGEIADAFLSLTPGVHVERIDNHRDPSRYLDTREVADQARTIMARQGWQTAALLAHAHHLPRVIAVCQKLGIVTVVLPGLEHVRFCPDSCQKWTRNRRAWFCREVPSICFYRLKGWI